MKTKELVIMALFAAIGAALHSIIPPFLGGMKPDMMLIMMFMGILLFPRVQNVLVIGIVTGIISALSTAFPAGQIPNIIDKPVSAFLFFFLFLLVRKSQKTASAAVLTVIGTILSGTVFLTSALFIVGLPGGFAALFAAVVLPAAVLNTIAMIMMYPIVQTILRRSSFMEAAK
ncbi:tryptophan transporter [Bacillus halotolerans]|uniref:tryptophan transporter n=1 Tax=Bacillus halotolerans TaxID=260554 RepID=UPI001C3CD08A|nr:tryptophan transporter [Bacillus halotolerans]MBV5121123.1 tryptophan transporter [Bacillus halotolerans]MCC2114217.1 tryptophan transporter [Bacillus halotolerans]MDG3074956.1 tryptophan transporter [Bacillus halotolerans]